MNPEDGAAAAAGRNTAGGGGGAQPTGGPVLKKGPWTAVEDAILREYVRKHGEGNWNAVQRNCGLMRCGKSCRLRWANHLRPNLKKGAFTPEEERQIIELHSRFGNKWARMALHLEGRTDNEIKNYWNTRLKRRLRAGLPIYPVDLLQQTQPHHRNEEQPLQNQSFPFSSSSSSSNHVNTPLNSISPMLFDPMNYPMMNVPMYLPNPQSQFNFHRDNAQFTNISPPSMMVFNQGVPSSNHDASQIMAMEPPSIQSSFQAITPTCSSNTVNDYKIVPSNDGDNAISPSICPRQNNGLLADVLGESQTLLSPHMIFNKDKSSETDKGKGKMTDGYALMKQPQNVNLELVFDPRDNYKTSTHRDESSSGPSSIDIGVKSRSNVLEEINETDDDFTSWLDLPTGSLQDWYGGSGYVSTEKPINVSNRNTTGADNQVEILCSPAATTETGHDHDWTMGSCCWHNMPGCS